MADARTPMPARSGEEVPLRGRFKDLATGETVDLAKMDRKVLVYFWATYCSPCIEAIPELNELAASTAASEELSFISILVDPVFGAGMDHREDARSFVDSYDIDYPVLFDRANPSLTERFGVRAVPWTFLIDESGTVLSDKMTAGSDPAVIEAARAYLRSQRDDRPRDDESARTRKQRTSPAGPTTGGGDLQ